MNLYIYSDESGVLDKKHNDFFVFGGLIFINKESKDNCLRKYKNVERTFYKNHPESIGTELKATFLDNMNKSKFFRSLNNENKFCGIINERNVLDSIFNSKKSKQRYLDYVYKISVKKGFEKLENKGLINFNTVENLYFFVDEHTTATDGRYELKEALENEFKNGTFNYNYEKFFPPIFPNLKSINLRYCDSSQQPLIRASDIIANKVFYLYGNDKQKLSTINNMSIEIFP